MSHQLDPYYYFFACPEPFLIANKKYMCTNQWKLFLIQVIRMYRNFQQLGIPPKWAPQKKYGTFTVNSYQDDCHNVWMIAIFYMDWKHCLE